MPRKRVWSSLGINHIVATGNNSQIIFLDNDDRQFFLTYLNFLIKKTNNCILVNYCLMSTHFHCILFENNIGETSQIMQILLSKYANYFNQKYNRESSLFTQHFYNEPIEDERQLINTIKYIHNNPVKAGIVPTPGSYPWSSYTDYQRNDSKFADLDFIKKYDIPFEKILDATTANTPENNDIRMYYKSYDYIHDCIKEYYGSEKFYDVQSLSNEEKGKLIRYLVNEKNVEKSKIAKVLNCSRSQVYRELEKEK